MNGQRAIQFARNSNKENKISKEKYDPWIPQLPSFYKIGKMDPKLLLSLFIHQIKKKRVRKKKKKVSGTKDWTNRL